ncbi:unnamed protein product [Schistosoma margrebowiei]|uniref:Uncharacterized protein n=1 Tax=Schistosoma margrebowiei TaxID=48269 RepID=A0A183N8X6_9TREM|nr:unnamed protein product [Schistosoma margrebowiei]
MKNVKTRRGADIASDHHPIGAMMKLKLKKHWTTGGTALQRFNKAFLRDTNKLNEFKIILNKRFQALQDLLKEEETTMEDNCKGIIEALTSTCQEIPGRNKHYHKEWISVETLDKIQARKNKKTAISNSQITTQKIKPQAEYTEANEQVEKSIKADNQKYIMTTRVTTAFASIGFNIHKGKTKILNYDMENTNSITLDDETL